MSEKVVNRLVDMALIKPHPRNYNIHPDAQIMQLGMSHARLSQFRSAVLWQQPDGTYITLAGHGIIEAMKRNKVTQVRADIHPPTLSAADAEAILLADNLHAQNSQPDDSMLAHLLQEQQDAGFDLSSLGSDDETLRQMLENLGDSYLGGSGEQEDGEEDTLPDVVETRCKPGDIWQLGRHKLIVGDSSDPETLKTLMGNERADMILTDPPYGMNFDPGISEIGHNKGNWEHKPRHYDKVIGDDKDFDPRPFMDYFSYCKEQFWWGADYYPERIPDRNKGAWFVWDKREGLEEVEFTLSSFEMCWSRQKHTRQIVRQRWMGLIGTESQDVRSRIHPTQKPLQVCNFFIEKYSEPDALIVDLFLGSGTTLISCERLGRRCYGIEIKPEFVDIILARWEAESGQTAHLLDRVQEVAHV